jgi:hypothetical protein
MEREREIYAAALGSVQAGGKSLKQAQDPGGSTDQDKSEERGGERGKGNGVEARGEEEKVAVTRTQREDQK